MMFGPCGGPEMGTMTLSTGDGSQVLPACPPDNGWPALPSGGCWHKPLTGGAQMPPDEDPRGSIS